MVDPAKSREVAGREIDCSAGCRGTFGQRRLHQSANTFRREATVVLCASAAFFMITLDTSIVNLALPEVGRDFRIGLTGLQWVVEIYVVAFASFLIGAGALGDALGAKRVFIAGLTMFTLASGICCVASSAGILSGARLLQGLGAAMQLPTSLALLNEAVAAPQRRVEAISFWAGLGPVGLAAGPLVGGLLMQLCGWRAIFAVNLPVGGAIAALAWFCVPDSVGPNRRRLDIVGQSLMAVLLAAMTYLLIEGPRHGWTTGPSICIGVLAIAAPALVIVEARHPSPLLPLALVCNRQVAATSAAGLFHNIGIFGQLFVLGLVFQDVMHLSPFQAGLLFLPLTGALAIGTRVSARLVAARDTATPLIVGHLVAAAGALGMAFVGFRSANAGLILSMMMLGLGAGTTTPAMSISVLDAAPKTSKGVASGLLNTARQIGTVLGVAILGGGLRLPLDGHDASFASCCAAAALIAASLFGWISSSPRQSRF